MSEDILKRIVESKRARVDKRKRDVPPGVLKEQLKETELISRNFKKAISQKDGIALIAEIKKASPSAGVLREDFDPLMIAREYEAGADAISVLTEEDFFLGSVDILSEVRRAGSKPVLAKDFVIDEYQIYEARLSGADCILLIARILEEEALGKFLHMSRELGMDCLVEVHDEIELRKVVNSGAEIIGINNRNLENFEVDLKTTERLHKLTPLDTIVVSESGINTRGDVEYLSSVGADAILVGGAFMRAKNISAKIAELMGRG